MSGPLQGLKVFDLTYGGVGPWGTMLLATMGANVIKMEDPKLTSQRPFQRQGSGPQYQGLSVIYMACNLGKRCIHIDFR